MRLFITAILIGFILIFLGIEIAEEVSQFAKNVETITNIETYQNKPVMIWGDY